MIKITVGQGWQVYSDNRVRIYQEQDSNLAIFLDVKEYGDPAPLLIDLTDQSASITSIPHFVEKVEIRLAKEIVITWNIEPFKLSATEGVYEEME
ncbi:hypothetical protein PWEIH_02262 [Listeria weihenstephanensis FSL R9-0317]|uniref:Uncharacterized protein n=1 Tax=Listeria weihenstephanensis TaxID=1006155 RepID=A0A1S7FQZ1_9LIST|nr:hypothetical protein [Listeria weihenstephanensis]AQY49789.1 hypothetical protein UE46_01080 [Listeria weihenstephanensis]EUJ41092.1 hypothetical protein PWEIH_02262 [Listeria weihenstephanensis FSL R9-0317]MBC1499028.1 hypothetical protein [Listeria weihenstephanensis]